MIYIMAQPGIEPGPLHYQAYMLPHSHGFFSINTICTYQNVVKLLPMSRSRVFEGEMPEIFIVYNYA